MPPLPTMTKYFAAKPDNALALSNRSIAYWQKGELDKALADLDAALRLTPDDLNLVTDHGSVLKAKGEYDLAIADYDQVLAAKPDMPSSYIREGWHIG